MFAMGIMIHYLVISINLSDIAILNIVSVLIIVVLITELTKVRPWVY